MLRRPKIEKNWHHELLLCCLSHIITYRYDCGHKIDGTKPNQTANTVREKKTGEADRRKKTDKRSS